MLTQGDDIRRSHLRRALLTGAFGAVAVLGACNLSFPFKRPVRQLPPPTPEVTLCDPALGPCLAVLTPDAATIRPRPRTPVIRPKPRPTDAAITPAPVTNPENGQTVGAFDKTSAAEKAAVIAPDGAKGERKLGRTIASLGAVSVPGFWLKTPLVRAPVAGRIVWADNGNSIKVTLVPKADGGGSQISLAAMRALEIPLTALPPLIVFRAGK